MPNLDAMNHVIQGFVSEAADLCGAVTRDVLALERGAGDLVTFYENAARGLHTLKGGAGTIGLPDLERLAHGLEGALLSHQAGQLPIPSAVADSVLRGLDAFMARLRGHAEGRAAAPDASEGVLEEATYRGEPQPSGGGPQTWRVEAEQVIALMKEVERLRLIRLRLDERRRDLARARAALHASRETESSEVDAVLTGIDAAIAADGLETADVVAALEQGVKNIGTQPIRVIVEPLHRAVRDLCRSAGKEAALSLVGGEISLDRRILEALKGPLVHLTRNAVAHGIETPAERRRLGKHQVGTIVIRVEQQGNVVFIEVSDDGRGLDLEAIRRAAQESGVATEAVMARMGPKELQQLIFLPAVSTAPEVTSASGRGIGMNAVKKGLEGLHGRVEVQSIVAQGTRIVLTFPAGLGSSPILVVRSADLDVGIPMLSVDSIVAARPSDRAVFRADAEPASHRGEDLPVVDLGVLLGLRPPQSFIGGKLLLLRCQGRRIALAIDEVVGDMELVIRPLPREVAHLPIYQGASSLARGELVLIVRPDWLVGARPRHSLSAAPSATPSASTSASIFANASARTSPYVGDGGA